MTIDSHSGGYPPPIRGTSTASWNDGSPKAMALDKAQASMPLDAEALVKLQQRVETVKRTKEAAEEALRLAQAGLQRAAEEAAEKMLRDWPREILEPLVVALVQGLDWRLE